MTPELLWWRRPWLKAPLPEQTKKEKECKK